MDFNNHRNLIGKHAFLSASQYHWIRYDEAKIAAKVFTALQAQRGTELHEFASNAIRLGQKLQDTKQTLNMYVNDAIGYRMLPEQILYYSDNAFGTADAISFNKKKLRIHDLKTGETKTSVNQLEVYAAFFCLEYGFKPVDIEMELRIYQNDYVQVYEPDPVDIAYIMSKIVSFDRIINETRAEVQL